MLQAQRLDIVKRLEHKEQMFVKYLILDFENSNK